MSKKKQLTTPRMQVLESYPKAVAINLQGIKYKDNYYEIWDGIYYLGKGKSKAAAWKAASRNINN